MDVVEKVVESIPPRFDRVVVYILLIMAPVIVSVTIAINSQITAIRLQDERIAKLEAWKTDTDRAQRRIERNIVAIGSKLGLPMENPD